MPAPTPAPTPARAVRRRGPAWPTRHRGDAGLWTEPLSARAAAPPSPGAHRAESGGLGAVPGRGPGGRLHGAGLVNNELLHVRPSTFKRDRTINDRYMSTH
uniref:Uncharacterized protein n=1 Tax=Nonomuraea gerenzanensis TaxID=93944 RepID=A0A1M4ENI8_9ACTN|nr:hypothetical protein BN4615_P9901 [Nonomuraea gerenzanensis]